MNTVCVEGTLWCRPWKESEGLYKVQIQVVKCFKDGGEITSLFDVDLPGDLGERFERLYGELFDSDDQMVHIEGWLSQEFIEDPLMREEEKSLMERVAIVAERVSVLV